MGIDTDNATLGDEQADEFAKMLVDSKGRVLGLIPLPEPLLSIYGVFAPKVHGMLSQVGEPVVRDGVTAVVSSIPIDAVRDKADTIGHVTGRVFAYTLPYATFIRGSVDTIGNHKKNRNEILKELEPLFAANKAAGNQGIIDNITGGMFKTGHEHNKMIERVLSVVKTQTYSNLNQLVVQNLPAVLNTAQTQMIGQIKKMNTAADVAELSVADAQKLEKLKTTEKAINDYGTLVAGGLAKAGEKAITPPSINKTVSGMSLSKIYDLNNYLRIKTADGAQLNDAHVSQVASIVKDAFIRFQKEEKHGTIPNTSLDKASEKIARELVYGKMHPLTLVNIIGQELLLNEKKNGIKLDKVDAVIEQQINIMSKSSTVTTEEFLENKNYTLEDIKSHLASKDPEERALAVLLAQGSDELLKDAGLNKKEIIGLKKTLTGKVLQETMGNIIDNLASYPQTELEEKGLTQDTIDFIQTFAGNPQNVKRALNDPRLQQMVFDNIGDSIMREDSDFWRNLVERKARPNRRAQDSDNSVNDVESLDDEQAVASGSSTRSGPRGPMDFAGQKGSSSRGFGE